MKKPAFVSLILLVSLPAYSQITELVCVYSSPALGVEEKMIRIDADASIAYFDMQPLGSNEPNEKKASLETSDTEYRLKFETDLPAPTTHDVRIHRRTGKFEWGVDSELIAYVFEGTCSRFVSKNL